MINSKIEWTDHTFNPWIGCQRVGPGCDHCYAEAMMADRLKKVQWGPGAERVRTSLANWKQPLAWNAQHDEFFAQHGRRQRVFCASLADVFDNEVPTIWRHDLFKLINDTPNLDWLLLTKRIGNVMKMCGADGYMFDVLAERVWLGATITSQEEADRDIPKLLRVPARVRFLSMEPLLGPVDLARATYGSPDAWECRIEHGCDCVARGGCPRRKRNFGLDWVIVGGESGPGARPMHPDWARSLRNQCAAAGVPFLFKQWGEWLPAIKGRSVTGPVLILEGAAPFTDNPQWHGFEDGQKSARVGKKAAGRQLDGVQHDGFPTWSAA